MKKNKKNEKFSEIFWKSPKMVKKGVPPPPQIVLHQRLKQFGFLFSTKIARKIHG